MTRYFARMRGDHRAPRRHRREVHRRCGDGRVRDPAGPRGRRPARRARGWEIRDALASLNTELERSAGSPSASGPGSTRARWWQGTRDRDDPRHRGRRQHRGEARAGGAARRDPARPDHVQARPRRGRRGAGGPGRRQGQGRARRGVALRSVEPAPRAVPATSTRRWSARPGARTLADAWRRAVDERTPHLVTLVAPAGVGKSRLVREFMASARRRPGPRRTLPVLRRGHHVVARPRARPRGRGDHEERRSTEARAKVDGLSPATPRLRCRARIAISRLPSPRGGAQEELFWAVRRLLEHLAEARTDRSSSSRTSTGPRTRCSTSSTTSSTSQPASPSSSSPRPARAHEHGVRPSAPGKPATT